MISDQELQRRLKILKKNAEEGKISIASHLTEVLDSLEKVKMNPNGTVDLSTVDGRVRSLANAVSMIHERQETKSIPLHEVQEAYFQMLERFFGVPFDEMNKHNLTPHQIAVDVASRNNMVDAFSKDREGFCDAITEFWNAGSPIVYAHLEDMNSLKAIYSGDIFPSYTNNIASSVGLYMDTIVLCCPMMKVRQFLQLSMSPEKALYYAVKHGVNALQYKDLALAKVDVPIVVIAPQHSSTEESHMEWISEQGNEDFLYHMSKMFDKDFSSIESLNDFLKDFSTYKEVSKVIKQPERLLFDTDWTGAPEELMKKSIDELQVSFGKNAYGKGIANFMTRSFLGRFMSANDAVHSSRRYRGTPLMDAPTSWKYLQWKYQYDAERSTKSDSQERELIITHALQANKSPILKMLTNVPPKALIELRKEGVMSDLRTVINKGIGDINMCSDENVKEVVTTISANLDEALLKHQEQIDEWVSSGKKFLGQEVLPWIGEKTVSFVTGLIPVVGWVVSEAASELIETPSAKDLFMKGKKKMKDRDEFRRSPVGILLNHIKK